MNSSNSNLFKPPLNFNDGLFLQHVFRELQNAYIGVFIITMHMLIISPYVYFEW